MMMNNIMIGDRVRWECHAGTIRGEIVSMCLDRNGKGELIPWLLIEHTVNNKQVRDRLCGTESYLKMMKFVVTFRDANKEI